MFVVIDWKDIAGPVTAEDALAVHRECERRRISNVYDSIGVIAHPTAGVELYLNVNSQCEIFIRGIRYLLPTNQGAWLHYMGEARRVNAGELLKQYRGTP